MEGFLKRRLERSISIYLNFQFILVHDQNFSASQ